MIVPLSPFSRSIIMLDQEFWQRIMARNAAMTDWSYPAAELIFLDPETGRPMAALPSPRVEAPPQPLNVMLNWQLFINYYRQETKNDTLRFTLLNNVLNSYSAQVKSIERVYRERFVRRFSLYPADRAGQGRHIPPSNEAAGDAQSRRHGAESEPSPRLRQWPDIASRAGTWTETHRTDESRHYFEPRPMLRAPVGTSVTYGQYLASSVVLRQNTFTAQAAAQVWPRRGRLRNEALERMLPGIHAVQEFNRKLRVDYRWRDITAFRWPAAINRAGMSEGDPSSGMAATDLPVAGERGAISLGSGATLMWPQTVFRAAPDAEFTPETILAGQGELRTELHSRLDSELRLMERQTATLRKESRFTKIYLERTLRELIFERRDAVRAAQSLLAQAQRRMLSPGKSPETGGRDIIAERAVDRDSFSRLSAELRARPPGEWSAEPYAAPLAAVQARYQAPAGDGVRVAQPRDKALDRILPGIYALRELNAKAFAPIRVRPITWGYGTLGEQTSPHEEALGRGQDEITAMQNDAAALRRADAVMPSYREAITDIIFRAEEAALQAPAISSLTGEPRALRTERHELRQQQELQDLREQQERRE
ncbi:MAG: hypothetical protein Q4B48_07280, partial [Syntrophomonadaceae bacterium]|nr:hypothetical protein [Syntrophomonadaceae bacterium]